jgi:DNA-binding PadR family transcriptional regulator
LNKRAAEPGPAPLSAIEFHVLMVLADGASYGYAIMKAVAAHSGGVVSPEIGSLYRVLARLMEAGWVAEVPSPPGGRRGKRGLPRRYYALTEGGRAVALGEARRLVRLVALARERDLLPEGGSQ